MKSEDRKELSVHCSYDVTGTNRHHNTDNVIRESDDQELSVHGSYDVTSYTHPRHHNNTSSVIVKNEDG